MRQKLMAHETAARLTVLSFDLAQNGGPCGHEHRIFGLLRLRPCCALNLTLSTLRLCSLRSRGTRHFGARAKTACLAVRRRHSDGHRNLVNALRRHGSIPSADPGTV